MRRLAATLMYVGIAGVVVGLSELHASWNDYNYTDSRRFAWSLAYILALATSAYVLGLPDPSRRRTLLGSSLLAAATGALAVSVIQLFVGDALLPRVVVFGSALAVVPVFLATGWLAARARSRAQDRDRVVVVADTGEVDGLDVELAREPERPALLCGLVAPESVESPTADIGSLVDLAQAEGATVVVLSRAAQDDRNVVEQAEMLHARGVRIRSLTQFYAEWLGKLPISELERVSLLFDISELHSQAYGRVKRLIDILAGVAGLGVALLAIPVVVVGNLLANRGPLFFRQQRVGRNGRLFNLVKFRSMRPSDGGADHGEWTAPDDPRVTRFGRLLRVSRVDELPQVWNILRGDLSIVGPRPEQPVYVERLTSRIPVYAFRHLVRPGLTGWAQIKYPYAASEEESMEKLQYEFFYLRHQGIAFDLRIIGRTSRVLVSQGGR